MVAGRFEKSRLRAAAAPIGGLALFVAVTLPAPAAEFQCAAVRPSPSRQPAYARVDGQARCEGFYDRNVSQPFIELVSLTSTAPPSADAASLQLSVSRRVAAQLTVHPLRPAPFYRVDAMLEPGQALAWDAGPMLAATGLRVRDLGFLAQAAGGGGTDTFVPVTVSPAALPAADRAAAVQVVLRVSVPVASLAWRRQRLDGSDDGAGAWRDIPGPARFAWERVPFGLDLPADGRGVRVDVQALDADGKVLPLLRFNVSGPADGGS